MDLANFRNILNNQSSMESLAFLIEAKGNISVLDRLFGNIVGQSCRKPSRRATLNIRGTSGQDPCTVTRYHRPPRAFIHQDLIHYYLQVLMSIFPSPRPHLCRTSILINSLGVLFTRAMSQTPRSPKRFAPLDPRRSSGVSGAPLLKGIVFDVDGTLWYVVVFIQSFRCFYICFYDCVL